MTSSRWIVCAASLCLFSAASAGPWAIQEKIVAEGLPAGSSGHHFGQAIGADVKYGSNRVRALYIGAPNATVHYAPNNTDYPDAGAVYIYTQTSGGWHLSSTLNASGPQVGAHFGAAIAVQNGVIAVGEPDYDNAGHTNAGRAWIYEDYYTNSPTVTEPVLSSLKARTVDFDNAHFGSSVSVSGAGRVAGGAGTWVGVGAPGTVGAGCAYVVYFSDAMVYNEKGSVCAGTAGNAFGSSVAVYSLGATQLELLVGAPGETVGGQAAAGGAHLYVMNGMQQLTLIDDLYPPSPAIIDVFGSSVAVDSQRLYIGATGRDKSGTGRTGSVSLFKPASLIGYDFDVEVFPSNGAKPGDLCGASVYPDLGTGNGFAMGCPGSDGLVNNEGFARTVYPLPFIGGTIWIDQRLDVSDLPHGADDLGRAVVLVDDHVYAGTPYADDAVGTDNGAVRVFATDAIFDNGFD